jgi:hypothetical protein
MHSRSSVLSSIRTVHGLGGAVPPDVEKRPSPRGSIPADRRGWPLVEGSVVTLVTPS